MDKKTRDRLVAEYKDGYRAVAEALAGAPEDELDTAPAEGKWTAREIVHHLADSEMTSAVRLRLLLATPSPHIVGYDQDEFARKLHYRERPIEASLDAFNAARRSTAELLDLMSEAEWLREGIHSEHGAYSVHKWLELYAPHAHLHAEQILVARDAARKKKLG
ncbi:MAG: DinB family protein [Vicinamibacterales bacterium]